jgi:hypothetical protein
MPKFSQPGVILIATAVVIITSIVAANATQTITTPNAALVSYSLAAGANSAPITPTTNRSVLVMGCRTTDEGVGQVSLIHIPSTSIEWVGLESPAPSAISSGAGATAGIDIVYINTGHTVDIRVASADTILIHKGSSGTKAGNVTLVW